MVNERQTERPSSLFARTARRGSSFALQRPGSHLTSGEMMQPRAKVYTKETPVLVKGEKRISSMSENTAKNTTRFPPIPTKSPNTPRKSKVSFLTSNKLVMQRRRMSDPEESFNRPPKSILKKRHSVSIEYKTPTPENNQIDMSLLWTLPWERELYLPPIAHNGMLVFLDEDGSLPPMLRRLSNADTYNYSQEFLQALDDLKNRPLSSQDHNNDKTCR